MLIVFRYFHHNHHKWPFHCQFNRDRSYFSVKIAADVMSIIIKTQRVFGSNQFHE